MMWQWTPYTPLLAATAVFLFGFGAYVAAFRRGRWLSGTGLGGLLILVGGVWVAVYTVKLSAATLPAKVFVTRLELLVVLSLPIVWLAYVLRYVGRTEWLSWRVFGPLAAIAAGIELAVLTDGRHHLVYREYALSQAGSFVVFDPTYGPAFAVILGFVYTLLGTSLLFLTTAAVHAKGVFRWQVAILFLFALVPGAAGLLFVSGANPFPGLNVAALSFVAIAVGGAVSFVRFEWLEMTPIARDQAFESMTEAVVVLDAERRITDFNRPAAELFSGSTADAVGRPATDAFPELGSVLDGLDSEGEARTELTRHSDEDRRIIDVRISSISAAAGAVTGYTLLFHDITARKEAERQAEERRRKMERLHGVARDLTAAEARETVFQRAVDGAVEVIDADVCRLSVATDGELVPAASSADEPVAACDPQPADAGIAGTTYQSGGTVVVDDLADARNAAASGESTYLPDGATPDPDSHDGYRSLLSVSVGDAGVVQALADEPGAFGDSDREALELLAAHIGTTMERADVETELRTERDRLEEFASVVSHDLRNPLNVAQGRIGLLRDEAPAEHVDPIDRSLSRMEDIITDVLTLAREGEAVGDVAAVDLRTCAADAWDSVDTGSAVLRRDDDLGTVTADRGRLQQLLENLFRNSVEHGSTSSRTESGDSVEHGSTGNRAAPDDSVEHGSTSSRTKSDDSVEHGSTGNRAAPNDSVEHGSTSSRTESDSSADRGTADDDPSGPIVTVGRLDDGPGFYVADDGPGIPPDEREAIFEHGYTTGSDGTGLGLAIVARIVDAHGWTIHATDSASGGARFEIYTDS